MAKKSRKSTPKTSRASSQKGKGKSKKRPINPIALGLVIVFLGGLFAYPLLMQSNRKKAQPQRAATQGAAAPQQPKVPPAFKKEGELTFIRLPEGDSLRIDIELAQSEQETNQGLMFRTEMGAREGMLFIFDGMEERSFWMKNTIIPLDIIFVDDRYEIVSIKANTKPFSQAPVRSEAPAQYVVEVNAGFSQQHGLSVGDRVMFEAVLP